MFAFFDGEKSPSMDNPNVMREVRLWESNAEREHVENMSELFAVINALECLEKMFARDFITPDAYKTECFKLLDQYKVAMRVVRGTNVDAFVAKYGLHVPAALERIREGRPIVVKDDTGSQLKNIARITEIFITCGDYLKLGHRTPEDIFHSDLYTMISSASILPDQFEPKQTVKFWYDKLSSMKAVDELTEDEARQMQFEFEKAYEAFVQFLYSHK